MFSIVVPTYNNNHIYDTLESLLNQECDVPYEILVIHHEVPESHIKKIKSEYSSKKVIRFICNRKKGNIPISRNIGVLSAQYDFIEFIDDDCRVPKNYIKNLANHVEGLGDNYVLRGRVLFDHTDSLFSLYYSRIRYSWYSNEDMIFTPNLLVRKEVFYKVRLFDEYAMGGEDTEWGSYLLRYGYRVKFAEDIDINHKSEDYEGRPKTWIGYGKNKSYMLVKAVLENNLFGCYKILKSISGVKNYKFGEKPYFYFLVTIMNIYHVIGFIWGLFKNITNINTCRNRDGYLKSESYINHCLSFKES